MVYKKARDLGHPIIIACANHHRTMLQEMERLGKRQRTCIYQATVFKKHRFHGFDFDALAVLRVYRNDEDSLCWHYIKYPFANLKVTKLII